MQAIEPRELRNAFGTFITGVVVATTIEGDATPRGFTANSFTSVSLEPPLLLVCLAKSASVLSAFEAADGFAVNILAEEQQSVSGVFASKAVDRFAGLDWQLGPVGHPIFDGVTAWFDCTTESQIDAGDHLILLGRVAAFDFRPGTALGYVRGGYFSLGLEREGARAVESTTGAVVGVIVEQDGRLLLVDEGPDGQVRLPRRKHGKEHETPAVEAAKLLRSINVLDTTEYLFSVHEDPSNGTEYVYFRCEAMASSQPSVGTWYAESEIPWQSLPDDAVRTMLRRYFDERKWQFLGDLYW